MCAGHDIYTIYVHNAIRIVDNTAGTDLVYNYGTFDFKTKGFIIKFMRETSLHIGCVLIIDLLQNTTIFRESVNRTSIVFRFFTKTKVIKYEVNMQPENRTTKYDFLWTIVPLDCAISLTIILLDLRGYYACLK
ncbi:MAG: hypothetical protein IPN86_21995 [Saprospiraceae bacterium]|nr:hypothetical protein [Saprospiraceae bacterium]